MKNLFLRMWVVAVVVQNNHKHVVGDIKKNITLRRAELKHENFNGKHPPMVGENASSRWIKAQ
jgi:hypothetical protein